ncbi:MAG: hemerythrin domain-containing protein [Pseudomonadota bacterium]
MESIAEYLGQDHAHCDALFAEAEAAASQNDWGQAAAAHAAFRHAMAHHFAMEETVLFPAFETASGSAAGPTQVMRSEHVQMNALFDAMDAALRDRDSSAYLGHAETLLWLMRQHNLKEESVLYPMSDRVLVQQRAELLGRMAGIE